MQIYEDNLTARVNGQLQPLLGVSITVKDSNGISASLYSDDGVTPLAQPLTSDKNGYFGFYAANGKYTVYFASSQIGSFTRTIKLYDPDDAPPLTQSQAAASTGSTKIGNGGETVADSFNALQLADYTVLRAYTGPRKSVYVTGYLGTAAPSGIAGMFVRDDSDTATADDGGTVIMASNGKRWKRRFDGPVSVRWFGASGDGTTDDTAAIQAALNGRIRRIFIPAGTYKTTATLTINQDTVIEGAGGSAEINNQIISKISVSGDFDGMAVNTGSPGYYGWLTIKRLTISKEGGTANTNTGLKMTNFGPHVILESVACWHFATGFDLYAGIMQLNSCEARWCTLGYQLKGTSFVVQNSYAKDGGTGYRIKDQTVYACLIGCASDNNSGNAYEFIGTTGPFNTAFLSTSSNVHMQSCGAEVCGGYLYVDGNFALEVSNPSVSNISGKPGFLNVESARKVKLRGMEKIPLTDWLRINTAKCTPDVVIVEGDLPPQNLASPPAPTYTNITTAVAAPKTSYGLLQLAKTRVPYFNINSVGAGANNYSTIERGIFASQATSTSKLRFRAKVLSNGHKVCARIKFLALNTSGAGDSGGDVFLTAQNSGGAINRNAKSTATDVTVAMSTAASADGYTYVYFDISSTQTFQYLWDAECYCVYELFQADMVTEYNNWAVSRT
jgi:hypothetical protein